MKKILFILSLMLGMETQALCATHQNDSVRILFIENSYTHYHDMPAMIQQMASHVGQDQKMKIAFRQLTPGGSTFKRHLSDEKEMNVIKKGGWNYVVLQEQSSMPAMPTEEVARNVYPYARQLDSIVKHYNPSAEVIFYMTWGHKDGSQSRKDYPVSRTYEGMQSRLATSYIEMAHSTGAMCAPVGIAWRTVRKERPYETLYWPDCSHPSKLGSYLAANVIFSTIIRAPYQSSYTAGLDPSLAEYIQQTAQQTVFSSPELYNITPAKHQHKP